MGKKLDERALRKKETYRRRLKILLYILERGLIQIAELHRHFGIPYASLTTDISYLEKQVPYIIKIDEHHVVSLSSMSFNQSTREGCEEHRLEKLTISKHAFSLIDDGDVIFVGGGATVFFLAVEIALSSLRNLTVITNELNLQQLLLRRIREMVIFGGRINKRLPLVEVTSHKFIPFDLTKTNKASVHAIMSQYFRQYEMPTFNKAFLGVDGLSRESGCFCSSLSANNQRRASLNATDLVVILADHSKIGNVGQEHFISFDELKSEGIDYVIITDNQFPDKKTQRCVEAELHKFPPARVIVAEPTSPASRQ